MARLNPGRSSVPALGLLAHLGPLGDDIGVDPQQDQDLDEDDDDVDQPDSRSAGCAAWDNGQDYDCWLIGQVCPLLAK